MKGKLAPRYIGPYPVIQRIGDLAYKLQLPKELAGVHAVFHVSQSQMSSSTRRINSCRSSRSARNTLVRGVSREDTR